MNAKRHKLLVEEMHRLTPEQYKASQTVPLVIVLDDVRSLYNVGSIFRTADAMGVRALCLCGITGRPPQQEIHKTALGAEDAVPWTYYADILDCLRDLRHQGYAIAAVEQVEGSRKLGDDDVVDERPLALIMGNEVKGVAQSAVDAADYCIEVPQHGTKHSMNVAVTAGIVMWEICKNIRRRP